MSKHNHNRRKKKSTKTNEANHTPKTDETVTNQEKVQENEALKKAKKEPKEKKAFRLIAQSKEMLKNVSKTMEECNALLKRDLKEFNEAKIALRKGGLDDCMVLLGSLNCSDTKIEIDEPETVFASSSKAKPMVVKDISKGRFKGFVLAILAGVSVAVGLIYQATEKLGITLDVTTIPNDDTINDILSWFSIFIGEEPNAQLGLQLLGGASLVTAIIVYLLYRSYKKRSNLHFAVKQFVEVELYIEENANCKGKSNEIHEYLQSIIEVLKTSKVLLFEQYGKLNRIFYIEGNKDKATEYNEKSFFEIQETKELIKSIIKFINLPIVKDGKLSKESVLLLANSKRMIKSLLERVEK